METGEGGAAAAAAAAGGAEGDLPPGCCWWGAARGEGKKPPGAVCGEEAAAAGAAVWVWVWALAPWCGEVMAWEMVCDARAIAAISPGPSGYETGKPGAGAGCCATPLRRASRSRSASPRSSEGIQQGQQAMRQQPVRGFCRQ